VVLEGAASTRCTVDSLVHKNRQKKGRVGPQNLGEPKTFFDKFGHIFRHLAESWFTAIHDHAS